MKRRRHKQIRKIAWWFGISHSEAAMWLGIPWEDD